MKDVRTKQKRGRKDGIIEESEYIVLATVDYGWGLYKRVCMYESCEKIYAWFRLCWKSTLLF
jgi:hypothetical protein